MVEYRADIIWKTPEEIKPNNYNSNFMSSNLFKDLVDDIKRNKFFGAIIINKDNEIIDGEHRYLALKSLNAKKIPCIIEPDAKKDDVLSKTLTIRLNRERGYLLPAETGIVLQAMTKEVPLDILSQTTAIPMDELSLLTSIKFDPDLQKDTNTDKRIQWSNVDFMIGNLAEKIEKTGYIFTDVVTVSRGGLVPARLLADKLDLDHIQVLRGSEVAGKDSLFIDDIYDSGKTYRKYAKGSKLACFLHMREGTEAPHNVIYSDVAQGIAYQVYPWDRSEFRRKMTTKQRTADNKKISK